MANIRRSRKSGYTLRGGVMRRESRWLGIATVSSTLTAVGGVLQTSLAAASLALRPFTVVRTHVSWLLESDNAAGAERQICGYGHAVVSDQAVTVGVSAIPTPITDQGSDLWYVYALLMGAGNISGTMSQRSGFTGTIDSRAMRKVEDGQDIVTVVEFDAVGAGLVITVGGRDLIKLH